FNVRFRPFGGHAEKTQSMSLLGVKRTWIDAPHMSAFDPKRTFGDLIKTFQTEFRNQSQPRL
ncbi:MAG: hypothetical protein WA375_00335, partial [Pseudolabrys sp.]